MLKMLLLASLVALPAAAAPHPHPPTPPGPPSPGPLPRTCKAEGPVLLEIDTTILPVNLADKGGVMVSRLFANGGFERHVKTAKGEVRSLVGPGCADDKERTRVADELAAAPFVLGHDAIACAAISRDFTTYSVAGKVVFTDRMCNHDYLDQASQAALADAAAVLDRYTADPLTSSRGKPVK